MCLIFLSFNQHPDYPFIAVANRDEFYERPAKPLAFWPEYPTIAAGKDLSGGGTWLGATKTGHFAMLTNYRDMANIKPKAPTRGKLVLDFLIGKIDPATYLQALLVSANLYNGYNLILGSFDDPWYFSNQSNKSYRLGTGSYGLSNALLDTTWPKVEYGKNVFNKIVNQKDIDPEELFTMMLNKELAEDDKLPETGIGYKKEKLLSSMFIDMPGYGTRNTTLIIKNRSGEVLIKERTFERNNSSTIDNEVTFKIVQ